jgi:hypothetical protein
MREMVKPSRGGEGFHGRAGATSVIRVSQRYCGGAPENMDE